ncbi:MAG TPA: metal ABC transporter substrate-binding protein [Verrucomicrobiales bacterium]|jgi:ABC-type Zn uptake system ZnuABC Zn-binding protein ZnuA|nr:metal ABC transporter substrate-binding protein [Verrucomicrobiales bacterium]
MMRRRHFLSLLPAGALAGCSEEPPPQKVPFPKVPWRVTATTHVAADFAGIIGGKAVQAQSFSPAGVSMETFAPNAPDIAKLHTSDIILTHGLGLERRWPVDFESLAKTGVKVFSTTSTIPTERLIRPSGKGGPPDIHVWTDPALAIQMAEAITAAFKEVMPQLAGYFSNRAYQLRIRLEEINRTALDRAKKLAPADRFLLTSHDTMQYFAAAYSLEARALAASGGTLPEQLPPALREWITGHGVRSLFREPSADPNALRRMLYELKVEPDRVIHTLALPAAGTTVVTPYKVYEVGSATGSLQHICEFIISTLASD